MRLIDANELLKYLNTNDCAYDGGEFQAYESCMMYVRDLVNAAPTIDPESLRPTAKWSIGRIEDHIVMNFICGNCGKRSELNYKYCPKCGARMIKNDKGW